MSILKHILFYLCTIVAVSILQILFFGNKLFSTTTLDLYLISAVYFALFGSRSTGLNYAFISGFFQDALIMSPFGVNTLIKLLLAYSVNLLRGKLDEELWITQVFVIFMSALVYFWGMTIFAGVLFRTDYSASLAGSLSYSLLNCIAGLLVFKLMQAWERIWQIDKAV